MTIDPLGIAASPEWLEMEAKAQAIFSECTSAKKFPTPSQTRWIGNAIMQCCDLGISPPRSYARLVQLALRRAEYRKIKETGGDFSKESVLIFKSPYRGGKSHADSTKQYQMAARKAAELMSDWPASGKFPHGIPNQIANACGADYKSVKSWIKEPGFREAWLEERKRIMGLDNAKQRWGQKPRPHRAKLLRAIRKSLTHKPS